MDIAKVLEQIGFDWKMALFNIVNFFIVFLILNKFLFGRVIQIIEERKKKVERSMQLIEQSKSAEKDAKELADNIVKGAKDEADRILTAAHTDAINSANKVKTDLGKEIESLKEKAAADIAKEREAKLSLLNKEIISVVLSATEKVAGKSVDQSEVESNTTKLLEEIR